MPLITAADDDVWGLRLSPRNAAGREGVRMGWHERGYRGKRCSIITRWLNSAVPRVAMRAFPAPSPLV